MLKFLMLNVIWMPIDILLFPKYLKVLITNQFWNFFSKICLIGGDSPSLSPGIGESPIAGVIVGDGDLNTLGVKCYRCVWLEPTADSLMFWSTVEPRYSVPRNSDFPQYSDFFTADQFLMY